MTTEPKKLTSDELQRLDALLSAARNFHYLSFLLAGISLALSSLESISTFQLPVGEISIPGLQSVVGIYLLVIILVFASSTLFQMAQPWIPLDIRRPPFAWIALSSEKLTARSINPWLLFPVFVCAVATGISIGEDVTGSIFNLIALLIFVGILMLGFPRVTSHYWNLIQSRTDHRGGPVTFSMYLLYWYRLIRNVVFSLLYFGVFLSIVPAWRKVLSNLTENFDPAFLIFGGVIIFLLRSIAGFSWIYRAIDRFGGLLKFPVKSEHYR